jgi:hypothetical protein
MNKVNTFALFRYKPFSKSKLAPPCTGTAGKGRAAGVRNILEFLAGADYGEKAQIGYRNSRTVRKT